MPQADIAWATVESVGKVPKLDGGHQTVPRVRAAQYVRMSTEHQTYSIDNQADAIRDYADIMAYDIVATYEDLGRSGLNLGGRPGLQKLLADVESGRADFETVVVYDVSRWGRFQNIDESAAYEYRCQMAGVRIEFCAEQFANDGSIGSDVLKAIKRSMAAEQSRMLSQKVFIGQARLIRLGFRQGGKAGFGLRRLLVDQHGRSKCILSSHEYKSQQTDRIVLVLGPPDEIATVKWIFSHFVRTRKTELEMARLLNKRGVLSDLGRPWTRESVHSVLTNENYKRLEQAFGPAEKPSSP
ncbi:recombinase family protein [Mesorhizobium sp. L2C085B000]|uniref:recombinase family protein n=1 Tax=Mesorhizobium sp. L2C085B000 TaxID=1287117 RepID=UPI001FDAC969|nr:recombinase family protein [Mesorhizobium sp. L2C085B000]